MNATANSKTMGRGGTHFSLKAKLSVAFLGVTLCCAAIAGILVDRNVRRTTVVTFEDRLSYETTMLAQMTATALFGEVDPTDTSLNDSVHALGDAVHTELSVIAKDGTVVANSMADDPHSLGPQATKPEIASARDTGRGVAIRDGRMYVAQAIVRDGKTLGFARSSVPMEEVTAYVLGVRTRMAYGSGIALLVAVVLGLLFSSTLVRPIRALSEGARRVGGGDFEHTIDVRTSDEIGELASSFNEMTGNLRRTVAMLDGRNRDMRIVLDNVTQGLLTVDRAGVVSKEKSAIVERWFGPVPEGTSFVDCIRAGDARAAESFALQWGQLEDGLLPLNLLLDQLPKRIARGSQLFELSYTPIFRDGDVETFEQLLIVITDVTERVAVEQAEAEQREVASILERVTRDKSGVLEFLMISEAQLRELESEVRPPLHETKRTLHTLKGNTAMFGLRRISSLCDRIETRMQDAEGDLSAEEIAQLRECWKQIAERLTSVLGDSSEVVIDDEEYSALLRAVLEGAPRAEVARLVRDWRLERVGKRLQRFAEQARELGRRLGKGELEVVVSPHGVRLPREEWSPFWSGFVHLVRNAVDHGLEAQDERRQAGKPESGRLQLSVVRNPHEVVVSVADDGRGIDWDRIAEKARALGLPTRDQDDLLDALFADGVSSKADATDVSGRGIGLSAVREACRALGGKVTVESRLGDGTTFQCHIPVRPSVSVRPLRESARPSAGAAIT